MKAQLVLVGGRSSVPNILTILHQKPEVVIVLCSHESHSDFPKFKRVVEAALPTCIVEELPPSDAFDLQEIASRCIKAFQRYSEAEWICNITAATAIMSIAIYLQAKELNNACWYLNTAKTRVITLVGPKVDTEHENILFYLKVEQYIEAYYFSLENGDLEDRRVFCEQKWLPFAQTLGKEPRLALHLKQILKAIGNNKPKRDQPKGYTLPNMPQEVHDLLKKATEFELVSKLISSSDSLKFTLNYLQYSFLDGGWLELYVWNEARQVKSSDQHGLFDDCQWNHKVTISGVKRELDVALTYKAQLLIVECKTGDDDTTKPETRNGLVSVANPLGGRFVGKILVSSLFSPPDIDPALLQNDGILREQIKGHKEFLTKADRDQIVVFMAENLPRIGELLATEALTPKYPRI